MGAGDATGLPGVVLDDLPEWLRPVAVAAAAIDGEELSRFLPPEGVRTRKGSVLMLFVDGPDGAELVLTERAHDMRSHPGQVSFPGGSIDPGETVVDAALREAEEEIGIDPSGVVAFGTLPELWLPPSNFAVTPVLGWWRRPHPITVASPEEVHEIHRVSLRHLEAPQHRINVRHPSGWIGPGFLIGEDRDVILWGFTAGIITRFFEYLGWLPPVADAPTLELPDYMLAEYRAQSEGQADDESDEPTDDQSDDRAVGRADTDLDIVEPDPGGGTST